MRKKRGDTKISLKLSDEQQAEFHAFAVKQSSVQKAAAYLLAQYGIKLSVVSVGAWLKGYERRDLKARVLAEVKSTAGASAELIGEIGEEWINRGAKAIIDQKIFDMLEDGKSAEEVREWIECSAMFGGDINAQERNKLAARKNSLDERKVKLLEQKAAQLDAIKTEVKSKGGLTPETLKLIEEKIRA
jgi:hypothetical protein